MSDASEVTAAAGLDDDPFAAEDREFFAITPTLRRQWLLPPVILFVIGSGAVVALSVFGTTNGKGLSAFGWVLLAAGLWTDCWAVLLLIRGHLASIRDELSESWANLLVRAIGGTVYFIGLMVVAELSGPGFATCLCLAPAVIVFKYSRYSMNTDYSATYRWQLERAIWWCVLGYGVALAVSSSILGLIGLTDDRLPEHTVVAWVGSGAVEFVAGIVAVIVAIVNRRWVLRHQPEIENPNAILTLKDLLGALARPYPL